MEKYYEKKRSNTVFAPCRGKVFQIAGMIGANGEAVAWFSPPVGERSFKSYLLEAAYCLALYITLRRGLQNRLYFIDNPISISYKPVSIYSDADF